MKKCSTVDLQFIISKSLLLQDLLIRLPDAQLKDVLISPRKEFMAKLKKRIRVRQKLEN